MFKKGEINNPKGRGAYKSGMQLLQEIFAQMAADPTTPMSDKIEVLKMMCKEQANAFRRRVENAEEKRNQGYKNGRKK